MREASLSRLERRWRKVIHKEGPSGDQTWVLDLCGHQEPAVLERAREFDENDEPPLFTRYKQIKFLRGVPLSISGPIILRSALDILKDIAAVINATTLVDGQFYSACVTLMDWDWCREAPEEQTIPTPCLSVNPHAEIETPGFIVAPYSDDARAVSEWLAQLGDEYAKPFCVAESAPHLSSCLHRVYVGFEDTSRNLRSTGYNLSRS